MTTEITPHHHIQARQTGFLRDVGSIAVRSVR